MKPMILFLFLLVACTVGPDYKRPDKISDRKIDAVLKSELPHEKVFLTIKDKTLKILIETALKNAPDLKIAKTKLKQARASLGITTANTLPSLDAGAKYNYLKESKNIGLLMDEDYYQVGFDASWELDIFGANRRKRESSEAFLRQMIENLKDVQISLSAEIMMNYINLRTNEVLLKNTKETLKRLKTLYETTENKYVAGLVSETDLNQARYNLSKAEQNIPKLQTQIVNYQNALAFLVGKLPTELNDFLKKNTADTDILDYTYITSVPARIIRNRPDVRMAEEQLIAQNAQIGVAIAQMYPDVSLSALFGLQSLNANKLFNHKSYTMNFVPEISLPLFHFGALKENVNLQKALAEELTENYEKSVLNAVMEIANVLKSFQNTGQELLSAENALKQMQKKLDLIRRQHISGLTSIDNVADAEINVLDSLTDLANTNNKLYESIIGLYKATGGLDFKRK